MRVVEDGQKQKRELVSLEQARKQLHGLGFWSEDMPAQDAKVVPIPVTDRTRLGLTVNDCTYPILDRSGLWRELGMSSKFFEEYENDAELMASMMQHSLRKRVGHSLRFTGHHRGVTTVTAATGVWFAPVDVFDIIAEELKGSVEDIQLGKKGLDMRFVGEYSTEPPKKRGDISHAGIVVRMNGNVKIGPYCYRMVCANGMMHMQEKLQFAPSRDMIVTAVRTAVQAHYAAGQQLTDQLVALDNQPFEGNREQLLIRLGHDSGLSARFVAKALERMPELPEAATMYDMINLITLLASEQRQPAKIQARAGRMVQYLTAEHAHCHTCGHDICDH